MFKRLKRIFHKMIGITEKELKLGLRFPYRFFVRIFIKPYIFLIPFIILYMGLLGGEEPNIISTLYLIFETPETSFESAVYLYQLYQFLKNTFFTSVNESNYLSWLLVGNVIFICSRNGFEVFNDRFRQEKNWNTIEGVLLAPVNRYLMLLGYIILAFIESIVVFIMLMMISSFVTPTSIWQIFLIFLIACLIIIASSGFGLISGAIFISNESFRELFELIEFFILFLSTYNIAFEYFPSFLQVMVSLNPFYHGVELARSIYYGNFTPNLLFSLGYFIIFTVIIIIIGVYLFNKIWKKFGIHGL